MRALILPVVMIGFKLDLAMMKLWVVRVLMSCMEIKALIRCWVD